MRTYCYHSRHIVVHRGLSLFVLRDVDHFSVNNFDVVSAHGPMRRVFVEMLALMCGVCLLGFSGQIAFPGVVGVPFTLQPLVILCIGLFCCPRYVAMLFLAFFSLGCVGVPLFSFLGGKLLWGPTGGFLIGMGFTSWSIAALRMTGFFRCSTSHFALCLGGIVVIYTCGWLWLTTAWKVSITFWHVAAVFGLQDVLKAFLASFVIVPFLQKKLA